MLSSLSSWLLEAMSGTHRVYSNCYCNERTLETGLCLSLAMLPFLTRARCPLARVPLRSHFCAESSTTRGGTPKASDPQTVVDPPCRRAGSAVGPYQTRGPALRGQFSARTVLSGHSSPGWPPLAASVQEAVGCTPLQAPAPTPGRTIEGHVIWLSLFIVTFWRLNLWDGELFPFWNLWYEQIKQTLSDMTHW